MMLRDRDSFFPFSPWPQYLSMDSFFFLLIFLPVMRDASVLETCHQHPSALSNPSVQKNHCAKGAQSSIRKVGRFKGMKTYVVDSAT